jgi:peroxiredoxin
MTGRRTLVTERALTDLGAALVAISPQVPGKLVAIKNRFGFGFPVASDPDNGLARRFGITFTASPASQAHTRANGGDLGAELGTGQWELPMPTVVVVGQDRVVAFADVAPERRSPCQSSSSASHAP